MDSIKKKMQSLANETASAVMKFEKWEKELNRINENADSLEEQVKRELWIMNKGVNLCLTLLLTFHSIPCCVYESDRSSVNTSVHPSVCL